MSRWAVGYASLVAAAIVIAAAVTAAHAGGWTGVRGTAGAITASCAFTLPDSQGDLDGDGATNGDEAVIGTHPCRPDTDDDGFRDLPATAHTGQNTEPSRDNCPVDTNPAQLNTDGDFVNLQPAKAFDDLTQPNSDAAGDACDLDDDNDGLADADEVTGVLCGGAVTDSTRADTDGDRIIDGAECVHDTNPLMPNTPPPACLSGPNADGDGIIAGREFCYYGTSDSNLNSDADNCSDRREIMSINADFAVNAIDLSQVAQAFGPYAFGAATYRYDFDVTKDGNINAIDLSQVAQAFGSCP